MDRINDIFDKMDNWRNLPKYQLERRSDLFFAIYLKEVLEAKFGILLKDQIIPEFPIHKKTIKLASSGEESCNVDFVAFANDNSKCFFEELKTDNASKRDKQDKYLADAKSVGLKPLILSLKNIFLATKQKQKYFNLFKMLDEVGVVTLDPKLQIKLFSSHRQGASELIRGIDCEICELNEINIVYILPGRTKASVKLSQGNNTIIYFEEFSELISEDDDAITNRFRQSLKKWSETVAGDLAYHSDT